MPNPNQNILEFRPRKARTIMATIQTIIEIKASFNYVRYNESY